MKSLPLLRFNSVVVVPPTSLNCRRSRAFLRKFGLTNSICSQCGTLSVVFHMNKLDWEQLDFFVYIERNLTSCSLKTLTLVSLLCDLDFSLSLMVCSLVLAMYCVLLLKTHFGGSLPLRDQCFEL